MENLLGASLLHLLNQIEITSKLSDVFQFTNSCFCIDNETYSNTIQRFISLKAVDIKDAAPLVSSSYSALRGKENSIKTVRSYPTSLSLILAAGRFN
jgi:hypothetical protein